MRKPKHWRAFVAAALLLAVCLLCACGAAPGPIMESLAPAPEAMADSAMEAPSAGAEIALLSTEDRLQSDFGQAVWSAIERFGGENGTTRGTYKTEPGDAEAALATLELAVRGGARLVVAMDEAVSAEVAAAAGQYPEVDFMLLDAPAAAVPAANTVVVDFSAVQGGWMAGYTAVYEENATLGLVQADDTRSTAYALGFALGAEAAAKESNLAPGSLRLLVSPPEDASALPLDEQAAALVEAGASLIFAAAPMAQQQAVLNAVADSGGRMFGIGLDLPNAGAAALASLEFEPRALVSGLLEAWRDGSFGTPGILEGTVGDGDIRLQVEAGRFSNAREWPLQQAPVRFKDGSLAAQLAKQTSGGVPTLGELTLAYVVPGPPIADDFPDSSVPNSASDSVSDSE